MKRPESMIEEADEPAVESVARMLARWHGSAISHSSSEGEMQTVASGYAGHRWAHASDEYACAKWRQYRGAARHALSMVATEREACAKIVEKFAEADTVYPEGIRMLADAIRNPSR